MKKQSNNGKIIYFSAISVLVVVFGLFVLEKSHVTNFYTKASPSEAEQVQPVNTIDYSPATPTDNEGINKQKEDGTLGSDTTQQPNNSAPINVVLTAAGQDQVGGPVVVKALLTDVKNGSCALMLTKDDVIKNYSAAVVNTGTYYSCDGFAVPVADLSAGTWVVNLSVTSGSRTGIAEQSTEVRL
jgi:hypothetical protein